MTQKIKFIVPFFILFALLGLLWHELFYAKPNELPSALLGETIPSFKLPILSHPEKIFTQKNLIGRVSLLNIWATWCYACTIEQPILMEIKEKYHVPIYSIAYKDDAISVQKWLEKLGNPYVLTGLDKNGDVAIDLGVYGTPETFVISSKGKIIYRHVGIIDQQAWDRVLYPLIQKYTEK